MNTKQTRALQSFRRVEEWFVQHPAVVPGSGSSAAALGGQVDALKQVVVHMTAQGTEQTTQASLATLAAKDEATLRTTLRSLHMSAIVRVAHALRGKVPGTGVFKLPSHNMSSDSLVRAAEAMSVTVAPYGGVFAEHGLPADFIAQLDAAAEELKSSVDARGVALSRRAGAGTGLGGDLALGKQVVSLIDASLSHALKADPATLTSWRQAKRVTVKGVSASRANNVASLAVQHVSSANGGVPAANGASPSASGSDSTVRSAAPSSNGGVPAAGTAAPVLDGDASAVSSTSLRSVGVETTAPMSENKAA
ncbi:MAG: hypothetical protein ABI442_11200 [Gemmatimonadaceae bacterium]